MKCKPAAAVVSELTSLSCCALPVTVMGLAVAKAGSPGRACSDATHAHSDGDSDEP
jgi:hypothetical protein